LARSVTAIAVDLAGKLTGDEMDPRTPEKGPRGTNVQARGPILRALFDMSFTEFLSLELVKLMYLAAIIFAVLATVTSLIAAFSNGFWAGIVAVLVAPFLLLVYIVSWRIWLELLIVLFRIADYARDISENTSILGRREPPSDQAR
jgi:hypothetical protein